MYQSERNNELIIITPSLPEVIASVLKHINKFLGKCTLKTSSVSKGNVEGLFEELFLVSELLTSKGLSQVKLELRFREKPSNEPISVLAPDAQTQDGEAASFSQSQHSRLFIECNGGGGPA